MQTDYAVCMSQLVRQHEEIKMTSTHALDLLQAWAEDGDTTQQDELRQLVVRCCRLVSHHTKQEEETIIPLLKEIYGADEDVSEYVRDQHSHLLEDLSAIAETLSGQDQLIDVGMISDIFNQLLEHKFIEEQALYPLVQAHIDKKKLS